MAERYQTFDLIQEITRNDGTRYNELGNIMMNGVAESAALKHLIKSVRILQLNIPHSTAVNRYESYINETYTFPTVDLDAWEEWAKPEGPIKQAYQEIMAQNHIG
ncbi:hypothetical protein [Lacticaseibacillus saniviri]|uniref:Uncharacterized protein n=1 Tax=Lacticaseibacillus saniviri JCM 17471 = DSM 24301 TaxID=1293598 RepID=A0A0R2MX24_9LACO|nr:hypothetical protein [Lacticaseibacillus saniviri]KRO17940.1 hypothetical protein IV56_GL001734 [Lacticaseibacillus saniviri JCM 17471 = DSM 24301]MCG4281724.1 hypothetical protein [Lacticaseibacillus saniviri]